MATFCPRSKLVLSKLIAFVCLVCTNRVSNKVNVRNPATREEKDNILRNSGFPRDLFLNDFLYRTTKTLILNPVYWKAK